jgi:hypothetical protein
MRFRKRTLRLYVYHNRYQELADNGAKLPKSFFGLLFNICYFTGLSLLYTIISPFLVLRFSWRQFVRDAKKTQLDIISKVKNFGLFRQWRLSMAVFLIFVLGGWGTFHSFILAAEAQKIKSRVLGDADLGVQSLTAGGLSLQGQDSAIAQKHFQEALENFSKIQSDLETNGLLLNGILKALPQRGDADKLTESAKLATEAGSSIANLYEQFRSLKFTPQGINGAGQKGENLTAILAEFQTASSKLSTIANLLESVNPSLIPEDKREIFRQVQSQLGTIRDNLTVATELSDLLGNIFLGQKDVLIMFENNNELRPTGGFLGTFGAMKINNGAIQQLHISSIYDLDGQLKEPINPPRPLYAVNDRWFLRDSNWFVDFPASARKISSFYVKEGGSTPDLVIALTPTTVTDLLAITGPVALPNYKVTLTSENFIEMTQLETSVNYDKSLNKPKQFLADFFPLFLQKLSNIEGVQSLAVLAAFQKNLQSKEIMLYAKNPDLQNKLKQFHWTGEVLSTDRDYLSIISANLGGTKTDLGIKQNATLTTHIETNGDVINTLTLTRKNPFPRKDNFINKSFVRILVPEGSTLLSVEGFSPSPVPNSIPPKGIIDSDVKEWESSSVQDLVSGTLIGSESGKTFFGNWIILEGGEEKTVKVNYRLPFKMGAADKQSLLFQKQSGVPAFPITYKVEYPDRKLQWSNKQPGTQDSNSATYNLSADVDQFFGMILGKN